MKKQKKSRLVLESPNGYRIYRASWLSNLLFDSRARYFLVRPKRIIPIAGSFWLWYCCECLCELDDEFRTVYYNTKG